MNAIAYTVTEHAGKQHIATVISKVEYSIAREPDGAWGVSTRRQGYGGRWHIGGFKRFDSLEQMAETGKRYHALAELVASVVVDGAIERIRAAA